MRNWPQCIWKKKYQAVRETITFASTGSACAARRLFRGGDYLQDVDVSVPHPQITDYGYYLDFYGQGLGRDAGNSCLFGQKSMPAYATTKGYQDAFKYCGNLVGMSGITLSSSGVLDANLAKRFTSCRYLVHYMPMFMQLMEVGLADNGTFIGAPPCTPSVAVPDSECPVGAGSQADEVMVWICIVLAMILGFIVLPVTCCARCCCWDRYKRTFCKKCTKGTKGDAKVAPTDDPAGNAVAFSSVQAPA